MNLDAKRANSFLRQLTAATEAPINNIAYRSRLALVALLVVSASAFAQTAPNLGSLAPFGVVSSTLSNTSAGTVITGNVCFTTGPAVTPVVTGTYGACPVAAGPDQLAALATVNGQLCTTLPVGPLEGISIGGGPPGTFPPGCYVRAGALDISVNGVVTLNGAGVYIFRSSAGALTTGANSRVNLAAGACASDVFWAPVGATTLGANAAPSPTPTFVGTILDAAGISLGQFANLSGRALAFGGTVTTNSSVIAVPTCAPFVPPVPPAAPTITKSFAPTSINAGGVSTLTVTLNNANAAVATLTASLTDNLPAGVVIAAAPNAATTCGGAGAPVALAGGSSVTLPAGRSIPANGSCTLTVDVTAAAAGSYLNTIPVGALVTSNGNNAASASATLAVVVPGAVPPTVAKAFTPGSITAGAVSTLTITLNNANATIATLNAALVDTLPAQVLIAAVPNASTTCGGAGAPVAVAGGSTVTLPAGRTIPANGSCTLSVNVTSAVVGAYINTIPIGALVTSNGNNAVAANATLTVTALAAIPIPTMSEWAMIMLAGMMAIAGFAALRRREDK